MLTEAHARNIIDIHGEAGAQWLRRLPALIGECEQRWSLTVLPPFASLTYSYVAPAVRSNGAEVVLKLAGPHPDFTAEMEALRLFDGQGMVTLVDGDVGLGAMVLDRLKPGMPLSSIADDEQATSIVAQVIRRLRRPSPSHKAFPTVADWGMALHRVRQRFQGGTGPLPASSVDRAEALLADLLGSMGEPVLLHGDLHQGNILSAGHENWLAIDPKGVIGEAEYEAGAFLRNQLLIQPSPEAVLRRRIDQLVDELGLDRERMVGWGVVQGVLSAWWAYEDHGRVPAEPLLCAQILAALG